jgi:hypothetical protein
VEYSVDFAKESYEIIYKEVLKEIEKDWFWLLII